MESNMCLWHIHIVSTNGKLNSHEDTGALALALNYSWLQPTISFVLEL